MTAKVLDGRALARRVRQELKEQVALLQRKPGLGVIVVGDDVASRTYVDGKKKAAAEVGIVSVERTLSADASEVDVLKCIAEFNEDPAIDGILLQLPLPDHLPERLLLDAIDPLKDVDGFSATNQGKLLTGQQTIVAATPKGVVRLLTEYKVVLVGKHAVIVGRSQIVGKPLAMLLLAEDCTVTMCHAKTTNLGEFTKQADVLVVAVGKSGLITSEMVKPGVVVVDVGMNKVDGKLRGDVAHGVSEVASMMSPVPGGVGPMTIAMVLENVVALSQLHQQTI